MRVPPKRWRVLGQLKWPSVLAALSLGGCGAGGPHSAAPEPEALAVPVGYSLVWSDEFDTDGLPNGSKWAYDTGLNKQGWHNKEQQYYSEARAENAEVRAGKLTITARLEQLAAAPDWGGQRYTSARLLTRGKAEWTYGYYEVRARLPCGQGTWPAIWMLGSQGDWPAAGELDIMEQVGKDPASVFSTVHTAAGSGGSGSGAATQVPDACTAFHTYQMHWTPDRISFGLDGKAHFVYANPKSGTTHWPFDAPQFLILNIAIGGDLGGTVDDRIFPVRMEIDYVRVYQKPK
jgi:beta-glucanase (GH16 family)